MKIVTNPCTKIVKEDMPESRSKLSQGNSIFQFKLGLTPSYIWEKFNYIADCSNNLSRRV
jgi:hypothetical protein